MILDNLSNVKIGDQNIYEARAGSNLIWSALGTGFIRVYDGVNTLIGSHVTIEAPKAVDSFIVGAESTGTTGAFRGNLTDLLIYDRALTESEIISIETGYSELPPNITPGVLPDYLTGEGTLGKVLYNEVASRADGSTSYPGHTRIYSTFNQPTSGYELNASGWMAGVDFGGLSVYKKNSIDGNMTTAITPWHTVGAAHYPLSTGAIVEFYDASGDNVIARTIEESFKGANSAIDDVIVYRLDEALPDSIKKYKLFPSDFSDYFPNVLVNGNTYQMKYLPIITCSHFRWQNPPDWPSSFGQPNRYAYFSEINVYSDLQGDIIDKITHLPARTAPNIYPEYNGGSGYDPIQGGDSGGPVFSLFSGDLILLGSHDYANQAPVLNTVSGGLQSYIDQIQPTGGEPPQYYETVNLSGFTKTKTLVRPSPPTSGLVAHFNSYSGVQVNESSIVESWTGTNNIVATAYNSSITYINTNKAITKDSLHFPTSTNSYLTFDLPSGLKNNQSRTIVSIGYYYFNFNLTGPRTMINSLLPETGRAHLFRNFYGNNGEGDLGYFARFKAGGTHELGLPALGEDALQVQTVVHKNLED